MLLSHSLHVIVKFEKTHYFLSVARIQEGTCIINLRDVSQLALALFLHLHLFNLARGLPDETFALREISRCALFLHISLLEAVNKMLTGLIRTHSVTVKEWVYCTQTDLKLFEKVSGSGL